MTTVIQPKIKVHLGCGPRNFGLDWYHVDAQGYPHVQSNSITKLPFEPMSVDIIYASHLFEYLDREEGRDVLQIWFNYLKPGGILRLAVPDFRAMAKLYIDNKFPIESFLGPLYGKISLADFSIYHKTVYDDISLANILYETGFKIVESWDWKTLEPHCRIDDCSQAYLPKMDKVHGTLISLNLQGIK